MNKVCFGCGVKLQCEDKTKKGYIPEAKISDATYCMRCFRMMHYGENTIVSTPKDAKEIINKINKDNKFVIFLVDFLNINKEIIKIFKSIKNRKLLIINKCELLPKNVKAEHVLDFVKNYYGIKSDIKIKGGVNSHGVKFLLRYLEEHGIKESYILGISNAGKSTLINDLMDATDKKLNKITVNSKANTTLDFLRVKLSDDLTLIDSPGFIIDDYLEYDTTGKMITAYSINMKECETVSLLDGKYYLKFDAPTPIVLYTNLEAKKPIKKFFRAADGLVNNIKVENDNQDLIIKGIGFIKIKNKVNISTNIDKKSLEVRDSMFGGKYDEDSCDE